MPVLTNDSRNVVGLFHWNTQKSDQDQLALSNWFLSLSAADRANIDAIRAEGYAEGYAEAMEYCYS